MNISILYDEFSSGWWTTAEAARVLGVRAGPLGRQLARFVPPPGWALDRGAANGLRRYRVRKVAPVLGPSARAVEAACGDMLLRLLSGPLPRPDMEDLSSIRSAVRLHLVDPATFALTDLGAEVAREIGGGR